MGEKRVEDGSLVVTNYRFGFFRNGGKKMDLPFGFVRECVISEKSS